MAIMELYMKNVIGNFFLMPKATNQHPSATYTSQVKSDNVNWYLQKPLRQVPFRVLTPSGCYSNSYTHENINNKALKHFPAYFSHPCSCFDDCDTGHKLALFSQALVKGSLSTPISLSKKTHQGRNSSIWESCRTR